MICMGVAYRNHQSVPGLLPGRIAPRAEDDHAPLVGAVGCDKTARAADPCWQHAAASFRVQGQEFGVYWLGLGDVGERRWRKAEKEGGEM